MALTLEETRMHGGIAGATDLSAAIDAFALRAADAAARRGAAIDAVLAQLWESRGAGKAA